MDEIGSHGRQGPYIQGQTITLELNEVPRWRCGESPKCIDSGGEMSRQKNGKQAQANQSVVGQKLQVIIMDMDGIILDTHISE